MWMLAGPSLGCALVGGLMQIKPYIEAAIAQRIGGARSANKAKAPHRISDHACHAPARVRPAGNAARAIGRSQCLEVEEQVSEGELPTTHQPRAGWRPRRHLISPAQ